MIVFKLKFFYKKFSRFCRTEFYTNPFLFEKKVFSCSDFINIFFSVFNPLTLLKFSGDRYSFKCFIYGLRRGL